MQDKKPQSNSPPTSRRISPDEQEWLDRINRQQSYDEWMQRKREYWLWERPRQKCK